MRSRLAPRSDPRLESLGSVAGVEVYLPTVVRIRLDRDAKAAAAFRKSVAEFVPRLAPRGSHSATAGSATLECTLRCVNGRRMLICIEV